MESLVLCSEDNSNLAVCACFCRFPLPTLCAECISKHEISPDVFQHFHLPVYASQCINSKDIRAQYSQWLFTLNSAYSMLRTNEDEMSRFEEQIEAMRLELVHQLNELVRDAKQRLAGLREAFSAEVQRAVRETSTHAMEKWSPEHGSLSSLVWNYKCADPSSLKILRMSAGAESIKQAIRVCVDTSLPSLEAFNQPLEASEQHIIQTLRQELEQNRRYQMESEEAANRCHRELAEEKQMYRELTAENAALKLEIENLRKNCILHCEELEDFKRARATHIQLLTDEIAAIKRKEITPLPDVSQSQSKPSQSAKSSTWIISSLFNRQSLRDPLVEAVSFRDQGLVEKAAFRYPECELLLQKSWRLLKFKPDNLTVTVGRMLGEVLGLHLARSAEAAEILEKSTEIAMTLDPQSEEVMQLNNLQAANRFLQGKFLETETICSSTLQSFSQMNHSSEHFWVAIFYLTFSLCELGKVSQAENQLADWLAKALKAENHISQLLKFAARGRLSKAKCSNLEAEEFLLHAQKLANYHCPFSIYAALILFWLGRLHEAVHDPENAISKHFEAQAIFADHYYNSIWSAFNLTWLSTLCNKIDGPKQAILKRSEALLIFNAHYPTHISTAICLTHLADLYSEFGMQEAAVQERLKAHCIFEAQFPTSRDFANNLSCLADLYKCLGKLEAALQQRVEAQRVYDAYFPTDIEAAINLAKKAGLYAEIDEREIAVQKRLEAHLIFHAHFPTSVHTAVNLGNLGLLYEEMGQMTAAEDMYQQARLLFSTYHPTSNHAATTLYNLALFYEAKGELEPARTCAASAYSIWRDNQLTHSLSEGLQLLHRLENSKSQE